jgi:hypothetical protein
VCYFDVSTATVSAGQCVAASNSTGCHGCFDAASIGDTTPGVVVCNETVALSMGVKISIWENIPIQIYKRMKIFECGSAIIATCCEHSD